MAFCNMCGAQIADGTATCAACAGRVATAPAVPQASVGGMTDNVAGISRHRFPCYEPYNKSRCPLSCVSVPVLAVAWTALVASALSPTFRSWLVDHPDLATSRTRGPSHLDHPHPQGESGSDAAP
jgi:hypothetical protein